MTDTPRSLNDILALLGDNSTQAISAQDMRDAMVSIADPVLDGGFLKAGPGLDGVAYVNWDVPAFPTGMDAPNGATYLPYREDTPENVTDGKIYDPQGWFQHDDDYESPDWYGETVPAGSWMLLPQGVYELNAFVSWSNNRTGRRQIFPADTCDNRVGDTDPQLDPWAWDPTYVLYNAQGIHADATALAAFTSGITFLFQGATQTIRVTPETEPVAFATYCAQDSGSTLSVVGGGLQIIRTSDKG